MWYNMGLVRNKKQFRLHFQVINKIVYRIVFSICISIFTVLKYTIAKWLEVMCSIFSSHILQLEQTVVELVHTFDEKPTVSV